MLDDNQLGTVHAAWMATNQEGVSLTKTELYDQVVLADTLLESAIDFIRDQLNADLTLLQRNMILYLCAQKRMELARSEALSNGNG